MFYRVLHVISKGGIRGHIVTAVETGSVCKKTQLDFKLIPIKLSKQTCSD